MLGVSEHDRHERDWYPTPPEVTKVICDFFKDYAISTVWEPACGDGAMVNVLKETFPDVVATDIHPLMQDAKTMDFYNGEIEYFDAIITNPPYGKEANKFIERTNHFVNERNCWGAILARNEFDSAKTRAKFFANNQNFLGKIVLLWRPRWFVDSKGSPRHNYAWYVWGPRESTAKPFLLYANKPSGF